MTSEQKALAAVAAAIKGLGHTRGADVCQRLVKAWSGCKTSPQVLAGVVYTLSEMGELESAMDILQEALSIQGETPDILQLVGKVAMQMEDYGVAEKIFTRAVQVAPDRAEFYLNLVSSLMKQDRNDTALELARDAVARFQDYAPLWNILGILAQNELGDYPSAMAFFQQAVELDPKSATHLYNLGSIHIIHLDAQEYWLREALALEPENAQIHLSYALLLFSEGRVEEAWPHYRYRREPRLGQNKAAQIDHPWKAWTGQPLDGKTIVVCAEQGIGDEVLFLGALEQATRGAAHIFVVCDPRLTQIVERSFKGVRAFPYEDTIRYGVRHRAFPSLVDHLSACGVKADYFALMGDLLEQACPAKADFAGLPSGYFVPDDETRTRMAPLLAPPPTSQSPSRPGQDGKRPKIGFSWRSGNLKNERKYFYLQLDLFLELAASVDADFYVLQYAMSDEERAQLKGYANIHCFDGVDMKQDIEANLAIISELDLVLGPPIATQFFALSVGTPIWLMNRGKPWYLLGDDAIPAFFPEGSRWWCTYDYKETPQKLVSDLIEALGQLPHKH